MKLITTETRAEYKPDASIEAAKSQEMVRQVQAEMNRRAAEPIKMDSGITESMFDDTKFTEAGGQISLF